MNLSTQANTGLAKSFWASCKREAYASLYHPFVVALAAGTLPKQTFQRYMAQDAYFLEAFKNAYQLAMETTTDEEAKAIIESLQRDVQEELNLHSSIMQSLDATDQNCFEPNMATTAYCDFLLATATGSNEAQKFGSTSAQIITAMTPCMRLYAFLGQELKKHVDHVADHPYQEWIDTYSAAEFEAAASKIEQLLDKLTATLTGKHEIAFLESLYLQAMNLEVDFFGAQLLGPVLVPFLKCQPAPESYILLASDFDSTCTISDSCPILADLTVQTARKSHGGRSVGESGASLLKKRWDDLVMQYMDEYEDVLKRSLVKKDNGSVNALSAENLQEFLKEMSNFEQKANARVEEAAVLKGLSLASIQEAGKSMPLREGCSDFFKRLESGEVLVDTCILSVCWSKTFIEAVLEKGEVRIPNINANELVFEGRISTGAIIKNVETALDKQRHFVQLLDNLKPTQDVLSIYVGDSLTDLLCLIRADLGIVLGDSSALKQVYGPKMAPLFMKAILLEQANMRGRQQPTGYVFTVSSWYEVEAFLLGPARNRPLYI
nr:bifunctional TH2 protein, mitochondrial-like isoform X3 [Physcomitrium patens]|eukprot:XP_024390005.1 bifunctional TH2 protein, mitochondrial-like isoform X3 [Physcomitrella patens]